MNQPKSVELEDQQSTGGAEVAVMERKERSEFRIFAPSEGKCLRTMSKDEYEAEFADCRHLLMLKRGQIVVGATTGNDRMRLASEFLDEHPEEVDSLLMFVTGPLGMRENLEGGGLSPTPTPSPRGRLR